MKKARCPICDKPMDGHGPKEWPEWPFCSQKCRLIDLGRWLNGSYRVESPNPAGDDDNQARPPKSAAPSAVPDRDEA